MQPRFGDGFLREYGLLLVLPLAVFFGQIWGQQELEQVSTFFHEYMFLLKIRANENI